MKITVYGGAGRIGGNKILLEGKSRVFLDFGVDFNAKSKFFSTFLQPRRFAMVKDYLSTHVLPFIDGLYVHDGSKPFADAVLISHGHMDHYGHAGLLRRDIPIYLGETTKLLIQARESSKPKSPENLLSTETKHIIHTFKTGETVRVNEHVFHPVHVDHSIPAAYGFVVETDGGTIAYTGDLRTHGPKAEMTWKYVEKCRQKHIDVLIIEGTRIDDTDASSEKTIETELKKVATDCSQKLVIVVVGMMDFDRLNTVLKVAEQSGRTAAISLEHAHVLEYLRKAGPRISCPEMKEDKLVAFLEKRRTGTYDRKDYPRWMAELLDKVPTVTEGTLRRNQSKYVLVLSRAEDIITLSDIKPDRDSPFVLSTSEPHSEEQVLEMDKVENWAELLGLRLFRIHASGHASQQALLKIVEEIDPRKVVPVHTEHPEHFTKLMPGREILTPEPGKPLLVF
ncbi:MAG: MBL fold metallo-hydrolase [Candidatus Caldarchaeum sp.]